MLISEAWLREWVNPQITTETLMAQVTMAGLEVDGDEPAAADFSGVIVGEIISAEKHPEADKLQICNVSNGTEEIQVVCGAKNARAGLKTAFATVGAVLPGDFKIKKAKLRGVESFGMLSSAKELGIGEDNDGIMELPSDFVTGSDLREAMSLNDTIIEIDLTPNRGDCLSIAGLAREVGTINKMSVSEPVMKTVAPSIDDTFPITVTAPQACPRYVSRVIKNVDLSKATPMWMVERLRRGGIRSIDAVVDVTNYVLLELGQPMHGFDLDKLSNKIDVRMATNGEKITLLDGQDVELKDDTLVIADDSGALAIAGIMGGQATGVTKSTNNILLESAHFDQIAIAGKARNYGLHTDSSHRFERGVDFKLQAKAIERATELLLAITGGEAGPVVEQNSAEHLPAKPLVTLTKKKADQYLGVELESERIVQTLTGLGLNLVADQDDGSSWIFNIPSWRFDISIEVDLIEELARIYGYNNLPTSAPRADLSLTKNEEVIVEADRFKDCLLSNGYQEVITYSFISEEIHKIVEPNLTAVALANPITAELAVMRTSIWPGLLKTLQYNLNRQQSRVNIVETGLTFVQQGDELIQEKMISGLAYGNRLPKGWFEDGKGVDFFDVKADVENMLGATRNQFDFVAAEHSSLHPGQSAAIQLNGETVGFMGTLHPQIAEKLSIKGDVVLFELNVAKIEAGTLPSFTELSKFPETARDIAVVVEADLSVAAVINEAKAQAGEFLTDLTLFDVYQGQGIEEGHKSLAMGLTWQHPERTLNEEEINAAMQAVIDSLAEKFSAVLRG
jgi:phenylalanyl-tRNA synthetase beta chain